MVYKNLSHKHGPLMLLKVGEITVVSFSNLTKEKNETIQSKLCIMGKRQAVIQYQESACYHMDRPLPVKSR